MKIHNRYALFVYLILILPSFQLVSSERPQSRAKVILKKDKLISAAYLAIERNQPDQIKQLITVGVRGEDLYKPPGYKRARGMPLLLFAIEKENANIVALFLENGSNPNMDAGDACFPLNSAAFKGNATIIELLIRHGASLEFRDMICPTALTEATERGNVQAIRQLLSAGAKPVADKWNGSQTLLMLAPDQQTRKTLMELGIDVNDRGLNNETALILAVRKGDLPYVQLLLQSGANLELSDDDGETPLLVAAYKGDSRIVNALLSAKANPNHVNKKGKSALDIAMEEPATTLEQNKNTNYKACIELIRGALSNHPVAQPGEPK